MLPLVGSSSGAAFRSSFYACMLSFLPLDVAAQPIRGDTLQSPPILQNLSQAPDTVEVKLIAEPTRLSVRPGVETEMWTYNGSSPGPTLEMREGDHVIIRFENRLPEETTVHWHGLRLPFAADGSPFDPVPAGGAYTYAFTVPDGSAGTYLYHPHPHHRTAWQMGMGLYGAIIIRSDEDPLAALPERLLILADNRFRPDGSIDFPDRDSEQSRIDAENGREGDVIFVNGQVMPKLTIRTGERQRWRVINASGARVYRLALNGHTLTHVGSDGGLFERPVDTAEVILANTERVEIVVHGTGAPHDEGMLQSLPYDRYMTRTRPADWEEPLDLMTLEYSGQPAVSSPDLPDTLRVVPPLDTGDAVATRVMRLSQGRINGNLMDMGRVDVAASLGTTEIWEVRNLVGMDHPFHLHGFQFQVLSVNGEAVPYRSWKDTVNVPARQSVKFIVRYDEHPGKWMFHCHILEHEDDGMMGILEVK